MNATSNLVPTRRVALVALAAGAGCQAAGLAIDAWLHARDHGLAAREGLVAPGNAGHVLLLLGIALVALGGALIVSGSIEARARSRWSRRVARLASPLVALVFLGGGLGLASAADMPGDGGHDHGDATSEGMGSGVVADRALDRPTRVRLDSQLGVARAVARRYPTVADAERAGFELAAPSVSLSGAHYVNWTRMDSAFEVAEPEQLLYDGTSAGSHIVGLSYFVVANGPPPKGFPGPNDHFHRHEGMCLRDHLLVGPEELTARQCRAAGGSKTHRFDGWMLHAWVVRGWSNPDGVFAPNHVRLVEPGAM